MTKRSVIHATFVIERVHGTAEILDALGAYLAGEKTGRALATAAEGS